MGQGSIYWVNVPTSPLLSSLLRKQRSQYQYKEVGFVTNVGQLSTPINNVPSRSINSHRASTARRKDISQESALKTKKGYIEREVLASAAGQFDTLLRTAQSDMGIGRGNLTINKIFELFNFIKIMCQFLICDCWWCSCCNVGCLGVGASMCCFGCWSCKHKQIVAFDYSCCTCCEQTGFGMECCCVGSVCCAPEWLRAFSKKKKSV